MKKMDAFRYIMNERLHISLKLVQIEYEMNINKLVMMFVLLQQLQ